MKLFKTIIPALIAVLGIGFTACSDDDDYTAGKASPGAFFPEGLPTEQLIEVEGHSFTVPVGRTSADAPASYEVTLTDPSGLFSIPTTVSFDGQSLTTDLVVSYDPAKVELGEPYELTFTLKGASDYGLAVYTLTVTRAYPRVTIPFPDDHNMGQFVYNSLFTGADAPMPVTVSYNPNDPRHNVYVFLGDEKTEELVFMSPDDGLPGIVLQVVIPDADNVLDNGCIPVRVPVQNLGNVGGGEIAICDYATYVSEVRGRPDLLPNYENASYYDPKTGVFSLSTAEFLVDEPGRGYNFGDYEYIFLAGFPDYSVDAEYAGILTAPNGSHSVIANVSLGKDVAVAKTALVAVENESEAIEAVINGTAADIQEITESGQVAYPVAEDGKYFITVVSYSEDKSLGESIAVPINVSLGGKEPSEFESIGTGAMQDAWILPAFSVGGAQVNPAEFVFPIEIGKHKEKADTYCLFSPYTSDNFGAASLNEFPAEREIVFLAEPDFVYFPAQLSGFGKKSWGGELTLCNNEGWVASKIGTEDKATLVAVMNKNSIELTTFEDGIITIYDSLFGIPANDNELGYHWKNYNVSMIAMPGATDAAVAKARAKAIAAPRFGTFTGAMMKSAVGREQLRNAVYVPGRALKSSPVK